MGAKRRSMLSWGGPLFGAMLGMIVMQGSTWFINYSPETLKMLNNVYLYGGLAAFSAFIGYDTQRMIESAKDGHKDHIDDALQMFSTSGPCLCSSSRSSVAVTDK